MHTNCEGQIIIFFSHVAPSASALAHLVVCIYCSIICQQNLDEYVLVCHGDYFFVVYYM